MNKILQIILLLQSVAVWDNKTKRSRFLLFSTALDALESITWTNIVELVYLYIEITFYCFKKESIIFSIVNQLPFVSINLWSKWLRQWLRRQLLKPVIVSRWWFIIKCQWRQKLFFQLLFIFLVSIKWKIYFNCEKCQKYCLDNDV